MGQAGDVTIRRARREDAEFLLPLIVSAGEGIPFFVWQQMAGPGKDPRQVGRARIESEETQISYRNAWIAEIEEKRGGCLVTRTLPAVPDPLDPATPSLFLPLQELEDEAPGSCYVYILSVMPELRGRGIGGKLLDFAERFRTPKGMSLIVADSNIRAKALYDRHGYREAAKRPMVKEGWDGKGEHWILMIKP